MEFKQRVTHILLAEPITDKGMSALRALGIKILEDDYLSDSGAYVKPFTLYEHEAKETYDEITDPDPPVTYTREVALNALINVKTSFENRLKEMEDSIFIIKGGTGSGKTTYVHHLKTECQDINFSFCDFEEAKKSINLFGQSYDFDKKYDSNVWKFISLLTEQITYILSGEDCCKGYGTHANYIKALTTIYDDFFEGDRYNHVIIDDDDMLNFFQCLKDYTDTTHDYTAFLRSLNELIKNRYDDFEQKDLRKEAVTYVCNILFRLTLCLCRLKPGKKYTYVIDNIEYFVPYDEKHPIQECELGTIVEGLSDSITHIRPRIRKFSEERTDYKTCYSVLLVMRDTSVSLTEIRHYDDYIRENEIDITTWYNFDDIFKSKEGLFGAMLSDLSGNPFYLAYKNIVDDLSPYNWGMHDMICKMFNFNYRRIGLDLVDAIANQPPDTIEQFNRDWKLSSLDANLQAVKHMCRKYVFRILLDAVKRSQYLDSILVEKRSASKRRHEKKTTNEKSSYARKVANVLYRANIENDLDINKEYMPFPKLIHAVLKPAYLGSPTDKQIEDLASILYEMNETRNQKTHWAQLIMIKFDVEQIYTKQTLTQEMLREWHEYVANDNTVSDQAQKYGAKITYAGAFFAKIVPDFEYFACRFTANFPALFVKENLLGSSGKHKYRCLELIDIVKENAFRCVDEVIARDNDFFGSTGRGAEDVDKFSMMYQEDTPYKWTYKSNIHDNTRAPHPYRILNHQIGYLQHYKEYIQWLSDNELNEKDKQNIIIGIQSVIKEYRDKLAAVIEKNPFYA